MNIGFKPYKNIISDFTQSVNMFFKIGGHFQCSALIMLKIKYNLYGIDILERLFYNMLCKEWEQTFQSYL